MFLKYKILAGLTIIPFGTMYKLLVYIDKTNKSNIIFGTLILMILVLLVYYTYHQLEYQ